MDSFEEKFPWNFMPYHQGYPMPGAMMPVESPMVPWMGMAGGYPVYPANMYPQAYLDEMQNERDMKKMKELSDIPAYPVTLSLMERPPRNDAERAVRGIYKTADCNEVAKKLSSGNWIAFDAKIAADGSIVYVLGWV